MIDHQIRDQLISHLDQLSIARQREVLHYAQSLSNEQNGATPGKNLLSLAGSISDADAREMLTAIEQECERIDPHEW